MFTRIVVPLDGSELAESALAPAEELASLSHVPLYLVRVLNLGRLIRVESSPMHEPYFDASTFQRALLDEQDDISRYLAQIEARVRTKGLTVSSEVLRGSPAEVIVAVTKPGDLLVMSTHGRGGLARWFLGSVAESVVRRASVPVMMVRATAAAGEQTAPPAAETA
jgi:nucleotide-binding universal stress UspA family protein